ncbi:GTP-binding protein [Pyrococcus furiosus DSM 3638]|uniref:GTP-binding protein, gtp1/obg family n=3 Tax=Pyrococcus furiosus TaxID=2261 RepID=Q8U054_PYRFU|nr:GTP-binding protein [Pyrococcus furiosus]AAL81887.1 GTP-binding protein, gtp1/obg family [Pyrococcus furiosus DSM 3638]AFN04878.1 gtp1/obg family GTP-binding protein [Pyrococcus furiosus COM1]QEK79365.1 GTP-binding protein [Pyrococcus furiosus DSM 3638]
MPTNVTAEYLAAEEEYRNAKTIPEKIRALEKMYALVPKHKGTEKLRLQIKRKLAELRKELEKQRQQRKGGGYSLAVKKEGAAQIVLVGLPNVGKSELLKALTGVDVESADYPFTTTEPVPAMLNYKDVQIQLVEVPGLIEGAALGKGMGPQLLAVVRNADAIAIVVDLSEDPVRQMNILLQEFERAGIKVNKKKPKVEIRKTPSGGIVINGIENIKGDIDEVMKMLREEKIHSAEITVMEPVTLEEFADALDDSLVWKKAIIIANKGDAPGSRANYEKLVKAFGERFKIIPVSAKKRINLEAVKEAIYEIADIIRVFTKSPGEEPAYPPIALRKGATVQDVAERIHKDLVKNFKYARVWGKSVKFPGQRVGLDHVLEDGDIVEIHAR